MVSLGQFGFPLLWRGHLQRVHYRSTIEKVASQRRTIAQSLQCCIHVTGVGEVLKAHETTELSAVVANRAIIKLLAAAHFVVVVVVVLLVCRKGLAGSGEEHLSLAGVAPQTLRGDVHVHGMRRIGTEMARVVVVDVLGTADLEAVLLQADPEVGTHGRALVTLRLLEWKCRKTLITCCCVLARFEVLRATDSA